MLNAYRFLWVNLQIQNLCDSRRIKVEDDLLEELSRLPQTLAGMYSLILENISQIEQHGRSVAELALKSLLCTLDSSSKTIIAVSSAENPRECRTLSIHDVLDVCSNLVVYDEALDRFRFAHLSVREFLESQTSYTSSEVNLSVARILLQILMSPRSEDSKMVRQYAHRHWIHHYRKVEEQRRKEFFEHCAKGFFFSGAESSEAYKTWATKASPLQWSWNSFTLTSFPLRDIPMSPVLLACRVGWLEIVEHYETYQSSDGFSESATEMMNVAIRYGSASVVRWLLARKVYPTDGQFKLAIDLKETEILQILIAEDSVSCQMLEHGQEILQIVMDAAIRNGLASVVRWLLARKIHPTDKQLKLAFNLRQSDILQIFLDEDSASCNMLVHDQDYLACAVRYGLKDIYQVLIEKGANFNCRDRNGQTLLFHASGKFSEDIEILEDLLLKGLDPLARDDTGRTPLSYLMWGISDQAYALSGSFGYHTSVIKDREKFLQGVLESYEQRTACLFVRYGDDTLLSDVSIRAQWKSILDSIAMFPTVQSDYSVSGATRSGNPARAPGDTSQGVSQMLLSLAALYRHEKAFRVLLGWGTNPTCPAIREAQKRANTVTQMGDSMSKQQTEGHEHKRHRNKTIDELRQGPLAWAAYTGDSSLVQSILDHGMDPNIQNRRGQAPLYFAAQQVENKYSRVDLVADKETIVRLLLHKGAIVTLADAYGGATILAQAFHARDSEMAHMLIENGAQIPKGAIGGPMKQIWVTFDRGREEVRKALDERFRAARAASLDLQPRIPSGDPVGIAAQLMLGGTMRILGNAILEACGDINDASQ